MAPKKFVKGQSGNPLGRPQGARNRFSEDVVSTFHADWAVHGAAAVATVRKKDPSTYLRAAVVFIPKDVAVTIEQRNSLGVDPVMWNGFQRVLAAIEECAPADTKPIEVFESMEQWVRSHFAKRISA